MSLAKFDLSGEGEIALSFATPFGIYNIENYLEIKDHLVSMCYNERKLDPDGRSRSNVNGWQSNDPWFYEERNEDFKIFLCEIIKKIFYESYDHHGKLGFSIGNCWININSKFSYNATHTHPGCDFSGVLYISVPESSGDILFQNRNGHEDYGTFGVYSSNFRTQFGATDQFGITPKDGMALIFPSSIPHCVETSKSDEERISIAFNIRITDYGEFAESYNIA